MKMKKNLRRFFTLDVHNHDGFTLVELIVVIAILAILSGVAVPAYSAYINKANEAADQQLLAALNTAYASACMAEGEDHIGRTDVSNISLGDDGLIPDSYTMTADADIDSAFNLFYEGGEFKVYEKLYFNKAIGVFQFLAASTFNLPGVMGGIEEAFNEIGQMLLVYGVGDPDEIEKILMKNLGEKVSGVLGLDDMLDGYLEATQLEGEALKAALEKYCPDYKNAEDKDAWMAAHPDEIKQLKANLGVMHFANSANNGDPEQLLGNVMQSVDSIVDAAVNFTAPEEEDVWKYYISTPRGKEILAQYNGDADAAYQAMSTSSSSDYNNFKNNKDPMLGLYGGELAALSNAVGNGTTNEAGINSLGALYALSAGYFNNPDYNGGQTEEVEIGSFKTVVDALMDPGFKDYYDNMGEADIAAYLEQMRGLSGKDGLDLTQGNVFTGVFTGAANS